MTAQYLAEPGTIEGRRTCGYCQCPLRRHAIRRYRDIEQNRALTTRMYCFDCDHPCLIVREPEVR